MNDDSSEEEARDLCADVTKLFGSFNNYITCAEFGSSLENLVLASYSNEVVILMSPRDRNYLFDENDELIFCKCTRQYFLERYHI